MTGDCEDFATLMVSLGKAEQNVDWLWCADVTLTDVNGSFCHACVFADVGDEMRIYDPTGGWYTENSYSEDYALNNYITENDFYSIEVNRIFNENSYVEFGNNQEFYDYF